jgi:hypothetical protein
MNRSMAMAGLVYSLTAWAAVAGPPFPNSGFPARTNQARPFLANTAAPSTGRVGIAAAGQVQRYRPLIARPAAPVARARPQFFQASPGAFNPGSPGAANPGGGSGFAGSTITQASVAPNGIAAGNGSGAGQGRGGILFVTVPTPTLYNQIIARRFFTGVLP